MGEKIIIDENPEEYGKEEMEFETQFSTSHDYIASAVQALAAVDEMDTALVSKTDEQRIKRIKRQSLRILSFYINEIYDETFENPVDTDSD